MSRPHQNGNRYDVIVIGSGAAGLTCATTLAQAGLHVLLTEKNEWLGGYSHGFSKDGFYWDHGGHIFLAYRLGAQARKVFQRLKLDQRVEMMPDKHDYRCIFPDDSVAIPADITEAADIFAEKFPEEREGIAKVLLTMEGLIEDADRFVPSFRVADHPGQRKLYDPLLEQFQRPKLGKFAGRVSGAFRAPGADLLKYESRTLTELLDEHIKSQRLKAYFSMLCAGIGEAPSRLSAVIAGVFFIHALRTMWMPKGGFGQLAKSLGEMFEESGGTLKTGCEVARIVVENGRAAGVETTAGDRYGADFVVSACDARRTFLEFLDPAHVPLELRQRLPRMELSPSIFQVHLGVDMDLTPFRKDIKRLNFIYPYDDIDRAMANFANGNIEEAAYFLYVATFHQPEMAPPGKHSLKLEAYTRLNAKGVDWERDKERIADTFIKRSEKIIPGLGKHIVTKALRTPADLRRDTGNSDGAFAGWAFTPALLSRERPAQRTPVPGVYLAGHWTRPTAGVPWVMLSGYNTAGMVIADRGRHQRLETRAAAREQAAAARAEATADR
ncbi:MAG TPA: NAD(P)/FAD-dependent oxidoreductase [Caulobacteraceae bacterium]